MVDVLHTSDPTKNKEMIAPPEIDMRNEAAEFRKGNPSSREIRKKLMSHIPNIRSGRIDLGPNGKLEEHIGKEGEPLNYYYLEMNMSDYLKLTNDKVDPTDLERMRQNFADEYSLGEPKIGVALRYDSLGKRNYSYLSDEVVASHGKDVSEVRTQFPEVLEPDFDKPLAVTAGWTGSTFDVVQIRDINEDDTFAPSLLERYLEESDVVFVLPSYGFDGAESLKNGKGKYVKVKDPKEIFNSGKAAFFYKDLKRLLKFGKFIGHSRGGDVALRLAADDSQLIVEADMPASCDTKNRFNKWGERMSAIFTSLKVANKVGGAVGGERYNMSTALSGPITDFLISGGDKSGGLSEEVKGALVQSHIRVIGNSSNAANEHVIGTLGEGYSGDWQKREFGWIPPLTVLARNDRLSAYGTVRPYIDERYKNYTERLKRLMFKPSKADQVVGEMMLDLVHENQGGHYAFVDPKVAEKIADKRKALSRRRQLMVSDLEFVKFLEYENNHPERNLQIRLNIVPASERIGLSSLKEQLYQGAENDPRRIINLSVYELDRLQRVANRVFGDTELIKQALPEKRKLVQPKTKKSLLGILFKN